MRKRYPCEEHPDYARWLAMKQRCQNPKSCNYARYGAKGISVDPLFECFDAFVSYIAQLPNYGTIGASLDRRDGSKNYEPGNLRWSSQSVQVANQLGSGKGQNKYTGVNWSVTHKRWIARVTLEGKTLLSKVCLSQEDALSVRNQFIKENDLPHPTQSWVGE